MTKKENSGAPLSFGVRVHIAYDGGDFHGWQFQPDQRTVQGCMHDALQALHVRTSRLRGVSRTDAGVHAEMQVVGFACDRELDGQRWVRALNAKLPQDIRATAAFNVDPKWDPRRVVAGKHYRYWIQTGVASNPLTRRQAWWIGKSFARKDIQTRTDNAGSYLDVRAMNEAAAHLIGTHDFQAFRAADDPRENTIRTMTHVNVTESAAHVHINVKGTAFMKNMVRIMAGTLVDVGRKRMAPGDIPGLLGPAATRQAAGPTAPAKGLSLIEVYIEDEFA